MAMINRRVKAIIQFRRATESEWIEKNPILRPGEPALSIDKGLIKVGDGTKNWSSLPYSGSNGISIVAVNGTDLTPDINKRVNIIVPTKTSELLNNSGFITENDIPSIPTKVSELFNDVGYITITSIPTKVSELDNDSHFISQETDPTVPAWAKQTNKPTYTASEVGALPNTTIIPSKTSDLINDSEFITLNDIPSIPSKTSDLINDSNFISQETDPTVPQWAKSPTKPTYTAGEVGALPDDTVIPSKVSDLDNDEGFIISPNVVYCTCATGKGTAAKVATIVSGTLTTLNVGDQAIVKFASSNTSASPTLKIGNTDAKQIMRYGTTTPSASADTSWNAGSPILFVYDGTYWVMCGYLNSTYSEISVANITNGSSSTTGLTSGRRAKNAVEAFAPIKDVQVNGTSVVSEGVAQIPEIPELVTDLGEIDGEQYEWDIDEYLNTLQETGSYIFQWDEFKYFVDIKAVEVDGTTTVQQIFWGTEEGSGTTAYRNIVVESGEVVSADTITYLTFQEANSAFSRNTHTHVRFATQSQSIWDYCNVVANQNANPIVIYFDLSTNKTYVIETFVGNRQPVYKLQKVTEMNDTSYFCQRSSYYYSGQEHWGDWYKFTGTVFTPSR